MRKLASAVFLTLAVAVPTFATITTPSESSKSQSYITYDDGGTIVRSGDDGREIEARVNLPLYPGDEVLTNRRGRAEIRLSDGNVLGIDRSTSVVFKTMTNSYEGGEANDTVAELRFGHIVVQRTDGSRELLRIDSENASYVATEEAIYAVEGDGHGKDRITVFDGTVEVRTPARTTRLRTGEEAHVDENGVYGVVSSPRGTADDFERWFSKRAERYAGRDSRYLDRSLAYAEDDLAGNGSWIYVSGYGGWCWRPYVSVGWRPYYSGHWSHGRGALTWVSYEPWGWVPYHYGRWGYDPLYGWVWLPGSGYAPAWVYWMYGANYVGWAPAGWYDCYRPYYNWAYRAHHERNFGFGFWGRVRVHDIDLKPWTFVTPNTLVSNRVDRAALTTDAVRERLMRGGGDGFATVSGSPARFSRNELKDPASAVNTIARRGLGSGTGKEGSGSPADMTPFFRRDPELSTAVRERILRSNPSDGTSRAAVTGGGGSGSGSTATVMPTDGRIGRDAGSGIRRGDPAGAGATTVERGSGGTVNRDWRREGGGSSTATPTPTTVDRSGISRPAPTTAPDSPRSTGAWRDRAGERVARPTAGESATRGEESPRRVERPSSDDWRGRVSRSGGDTPRAEQPRTTAPDSQPSDIPRRIIDRIGGARSRPADSTPRESAPPPRETTRSSGGGSNSGGNSGGGARSAPPPPPRETQAPPPSRPHDDGGRVKREHE